MLNILIVIFLVANAVFSALNFEVGNIEMAVFNAIVSAMLFAITCVVVREHHD